MALTNRNSRTPPAEPVDPLDLNALRLDILHKRQALGRVRRNGNGPPVLLASLALLVSQASALRPLRVLRLYALRHGPLMAAGSAYNMFFSIAAMLVAGFALFGLLVSGNTVLRELLVETIAGTTPGLIDTGGGGLATPEQLFSSGEAFGLTLAISTATLVLTSLGWIAGLREGMRGVFDLPPVPVNPVLLKIKDAGTLLVLGVSLLVTTAVGVVSSGALQLVIDLLRLDQRLAGPLTMAAGVLVSLLLDMLVAVILFKVASAIPLSKPVLFQVALLAGTGSTVLRLFSGLLLASVGRNPLLAPFAVILGLFVWFYLLSQVYLLAAAWGAVAERDRRARDQEALDAGRALSLRKRAALLRTGSEEHVPPLPRS